VEQGRINPDNLQILVSHVKCAAFELPFAEGETFGGEDLARSWASSRKSGSSTARGTAGTGRARAIPPTR
jgi:DEAD/DEAH box helicase domain-containing protein